MSERKKKRAYTNNYANEYFWRNYAQQEIDLIEEKDGFLSTYEFKWSDGKAPKMPNQWRIQYPDSSFDVINRENYLNFIA